MTYVVTVITVMIVLGTFASASSGVVADRSPASRIPWAPPMVSSPAHAALARYGDIGNFTVYVSSDGRDGADCGHNWTAPCRTLTFAAYIAHFAPQWLAVVLKVHSGEYDANNCGLLIDRHVIIVGNAGT